MEWDSSLLLTGVLALLALVSIGFVFKLARDKMHLAERAASASAEADAARESESRALGELKDLAAKASTLQEHVGELTRTAEQFRADRDKVKALYTQEVEQLRDRHAEKEAMLNERLAELTEQSRATFESLAARTLKTASDEFFKRADQSFQARREQAEVEHTQRRKGLDELLKPISDTLGKTQERLLKLDERIAQSAESSNSLRDETARLSRALSRPEVRGRYGEIQLRRVAELAGMTSYCDFEEQHSTTDADGKALRPDMVVRLPNDRQIIVDAKCNIDAYVQAVNSQSPDEQESLLDRFARHVSEQARALGSKKYWSQFDGSPEFVVMFIPGDHFIDAAMSRQPDLMEQAATSNVILASPSTLIGLLRAVHVGWREHRLAEEAQTLLRLGTELHERSARVLELSADLGRALGKSVSSYNALVGSMESRMLPTLRRFEDVGTTSRKQLTEPRAIDQTPREVAAEIESADATGPGHTPKLIETKQPASKAGKAKG